MATVEALGHSRGGLCSKLHAGTDGTGRILRLIASAGHHPNLRYATALASSIPAYDAALDHGYVSAPLRAELAAEGCIVHPHPSGARSITRMGFRAGCMAASCREPALAAQGLGRIALWRNKTRRSWTGFAHLAAAIINLRSVDARSQTLVQEATELPRPRRVLQLAECLGLNLPDTLAGDPKTLANFF